jgi:hypothetical protein
MNYNVEFDVAPHRLKISGRRPNEIVLTGLRNKSEGSSGRGGIQVHIDTTVICVVNVWSRSSIGKENTLYGTGSSFCD